MAMPSINSDNFLAVALVINRSRDGPAFVFHYPAQVQQVSASSQAPELEDILLERLSQPTHDDGSDGVAPKHQRNHDDHFVTESGTQIVPWEHVVGFPARDLAGILTPARSYHKRLFQLSLDPLYCVSYPIHVPENGKWKKPKKATKVAKNAKDGDELSPSLDVDPPSAGGNSSETPKEKVEKKAEDEEETDKGKEKEKEKDEKTEKTEKDEKRSSMTMFNLVFIMDPKKNEVKELVELLYDNIIKKVSKVFKYSQQHSEFVWKESKRILLLKEKGREERMSLPP